MRKFFLLLLVYLTVGTVVFAEPATLSFEPIDIKSRVGDTIEVKVNIFTGQEKAASSDVYIDYNPLYLEALPDKTNAGNLFSQVDAKLISPGRLYIYAIEDDRTKMKEELGTVATIYFKALSPAQTELQFSCNPFVKETSQIIRGDSTLQNIISCEATSAHSIRISISPKTQVLGAQSSRNTMIMNSVGIVLLLTGLSYLGVQIYKRHRISA